MVVKDVRNKRVVVAQRATVLLLSLLCFASLPNKRTYRILKVSKQNVLCSHDEISTM